MSVNRDHCQDAGFALKRGKGGSRESTPEAVAVKQMLPTSSTLEIKI